MQTSQSPATAPADETRRMLVAHNAFYAKIIDLIPKDLYKPKEETEETVASQKYFKHRKQPLAPDEKKADRKRKLTEKYSGAGGAQSDFAASLAEEAEADAAQTGSAPSSSQVQGPTAVSDSLADKSFGSLREKLQERIRLLHTDRTSTKPHKVQAASEAREKDRDKDKDKKKKQSSSSGSGILRNSGSGSGVGSAEDRTRAVMSALLTAGSSSSGGASAPPSSSAATAAGSSDEHSMDLDYGTIHGLAGEEGGKSISSAASSKAAGGKMARLKRMLEEAEKKRARLNQLKSDAYNAVVKKGITASTTATSSSSSGAGGASSSSSAAYSFGDNVALNKLRAEQWADAMRDAGGAGTAGGTMDAAKLKKAIKRIEKKKEKSGNEWAARADKVKADLNEKIGRRELNISARKKGVDPSVLAAEKAERAAAEGGGGSSEQATKRPRLFMHYKNKESEAASGEGAGDKRGGGGSGKPPSGKGHGGGGGGGKPNRPGFEGKKQGFLNNGGKKHK